MISFDRRASERRGYTPSTTISLGAALAEERRARRDRRELPRRASELRTIAHYENRIQARNSRLEVVVDGTEGMRLVAMFGCNCVAIEPVGAGAANVRINTCTEHRPPYVAIDRRSGNRC
jgi:hypothetical protein